MVVVAVVAVVVVVVVVEEEVVVVVVVGVEEVGQPCHLHNLNHLRENIYFSIL